MKGKTKFFIFNIAVLYKIFVRIILGFIIAFFIFGLLTIFVRFDKMKSSAMSNSTKNSIEKNETVITSKLRYAIAIKPFVSSLTGKTIIFSRPKRGDIIFMADPRSSRENFIKRFFSYVIYFATFGNVNISKKRYLIKRVIGLPNETIEIREKKVYINGSFLEESWANINNDLRFLNSEVSGRDNFGPYIIGYNEYFVLSDNRDYGYDSRDFGSVNFSFINGKVINR
ncbi:signal peptidase I [Brachyspira aalborgi]|uniref:Signal peptidase I n=1 Tax=Brachyspira aalborgi TaxID=29522 RepID=A0A5C8F998_9SPIR|nr:signal peptidase I [Brachyspira aalborgi]TXJ45681.1 signal peptidase I [Brachyspira aalborgi]